LFSAAGLGALSAGGYIGGHLVFARGLGVDHNIFDEAPADWTRVARERDLQADTPVRVQAGGYGVLLYSHAGAVHAIAARCSHAGGPLEEGEVDGGLCVTCPWHGSRFRLADGAVVRGPATSPQPSFEVRTTEGNIEVRPRGE
jgi:nitrite reductase/ring-hydroxylating ferredoxin subunit